MWEQSFQVRCRVLATLWIAAVLVASVQATAQHNNNFEIFRTATDNLFAGRDLYAAYPNHRDFFKYSPTFALLFAPFALVPFGTGVLLWNAVNAGALYWGLGRVLDARAAFAARAIVFFDTVGSMQNVQSNALSAGLMILAFADFERRRELRAALQIGIGTLIKIFPIIAGSFALFRPYRMPRFLGYSVLTAALMIFAPLAVASPSELLAQYRSWFAISESDALMRGYSIMEHVHLGLGVDWPNWPIQLVGALVLLAPLIRLSYWGLPNFRLLFLASTLMFCVIFNHKAESPSFVVALAGVAIWFVCVPRTRVAWAVLAIVMVMTVLSSSDAMPELLQEGFFEPYRVKTLPVLLVWMLTQRELWRDTIRQSASAPRPAPSSAPATGAI